MVITTDEGLKITMNETPVYALFGGPGLVNIRRATVIGIASTGKLTCRTIGGDVEFTVEPDEISLDRGLCFRKADEVLG